MTAWEAIRDAPRRLSEVVESSRPTLTGITSPPRRMAAVPFAVVVVVVLALGMVGLLFLNTYLQNQAFAVRKQQTIASELGYRVSDLEAQVTKAQAPSRLAAAATELGMVPNPNGVYIDLGTGRVVGEATPVRGDEIPSLQVRDVTAPTRPSAAPAPAASDPAATAPASTDPAATAPAPTDPAAAQAQAAAAPDAGAAAAPVDPATNADTDPAVPAQQAATLGGTP